MIMTDKFSNRHDSDWRVYRGLSEDQLAEQTKAAAAGAADADSKSPPATLSPRARDRLRLDTAPPWRRFDPGAPVAERGARFIVDDYITDRVNAALLLRRPLLVTGLPGTGKTSLTYAVARELGLGPVLRWSITSRTELRDGLYSYDALARLQDSQIEQNARAHGASAKPPPIEDYLKLGPLGAAFAGFTDPARADYPRVLLIDEIDKSDIDLPNDLLHIFEEGYFDIDELRRDREKEHPIDAGDDRHVDIPNGRVQCRAFPFVVMTSNSEREFPAPFLRRCIQLVIERPDEKRLKQIVRLKLEPLDPEAYEHYRDEIENRIIPAFSKLVDDKQRDLAVDQLLQVVLLRMKHTDPFDGTDPSNTKDHGKLIDALWKSLGEGGG